MRIQEIQTYDYLKRKVVVDGNGNLVLIPPIDKRLKTSIIEMIMRYIKGTSSRYLRQVFPQLKRRLPACGHTTTLWQRWEVSPWNHSNDRWKDNRANEESL